MVLGGVQTPNCIRGTAVEAIGLDYQVRSMMTVHIVIQLHMCSVHLWDGLQCVVLEDATASKSEAVQENNLEGVQINCPS